jgi:hypothetical protein
MSVKEDKEVEISIVKGAEGESVYINHYRVYGSKPWGGGFAVFTWKIKIQDIFDAMSEFIEESPQQERKIK